MHKINSNNLTVLFHEFLKHTERAKRHQIKSVETNKKNLQQHLKKIDALIRSINSDLLVTLSYNKEILKQLQWASFYIGAISLYTFILSLIYHMNIQKEDTLSIYQEYFYHIFSYNHPDVKGTPYEVLYSSYKYTINILGSPKAYKTIIHNMLELILICRNTKKGLAICSTFYKNKNFCNLDNFSEVILESDLQATPDSYHSMVIVSITTFLWTTYIYVLLYKRFLTQRVLRYQSIYDHRSQIQRMVPTLCRGLQNIDNEFLKMATETFRPKKSSPLFLKNSLYKIILACFFLLGGALFKGYYIKMILISELLKIITILLQKLIIKHIYPYLPQFLSEFYITA